MAMNKAAWFLVGATLGAAGGVGFTYLYMKDKFDKRLNEEVTALKTHYVERDRELARKNEEKKKKLEEKIYSSDEKNEFVDYTNMYIAQTNDEELKDAVNDLSNKVKLVDKVGDISAAAEIISDVEWDDPEYDNYKKITVDYFEDGVAFEALSGEEIEGFDAFVGDEYKTMFGEFTPNVVYVRNHELKTDYEIIEHSGSHPHPEDE